MAGVADYSGYWEQRHVSALARRRRARREPRELSPREGRPFRRFDAVLRIAVAQRVRCGSGFQCSDCTAVLGWAADTIGNADAIAFADCAAHPLLVACLCALDSTRSSVPASTTSRRMSGE